MAHTIIVSARQIGNTRLVEVLHYPVPNDLLMVIRRRFKCSGKIYENVLSSFVVQIKTDAPLSDVRDFVDTIARNNVPWPCTVVMQ